MLRKLGLGIVIAFSVAGMGVGLAEAVTSATTGTNVSCVTATLPSHTVGVDGAAVDKIAGTSTSNCNTVTYTVPTQTVTSTVTAPASSSSSSTTTPSSTSNSQSSSQTSSSQTITSSSTSSGPPTQGTVPCALTHTAGAGPNSCWATHTGVRGATGYTEAQIESNPSAAGFTVENGDMVITKPGTTITHEWIIGCVQIADGANNVTIKDSLITPEGDACAADNAGGSAVNTGQGPAIGEGTLIEDTTVDGGTPAYGSHSAGITVDGGEVLRVNLFGFAQGFISDSNTAAHAALFQDDYAHDFYGCSHDDGTWFNSSSYVTFEHGWIMTNDPTQQGAAGCSTGALTGGSDYGGGDHIVFDNSYGEGVTGEDTHAGCQWTASAFTNNVLSTDAKSYGSGFPTGNAGNTWSNNMAVDANGVNQGAVSNSGC